MDKRQPRSEDGRFKPAAPDGAPVERSSQQTAQALGISARKVERARTIMDHVDQETMDLEPYYTIFEICEIFVISKATVYNWLHGNEVQKPVIPRDGWIRLPGSGQIRIKGEIVKKLMSGDCSPRELDRG